MSDSYILYIKLSSSLPNDIQNYYINLSMRNSLPEDSGIDLCIPPNSITVNNNSIHTIDHMISCCMLDNNGTTTAYYLYPRSSISNYPLMLANSVGIIDAGYRGPIKAKVRCFDNNFIINSDIKLFQICAPNLSPLRVKIVDELPDSNRGAGGFGSTGN
jgi:dUTP pyrophosphatase